MSLDGRSPVLPLPPQAAMLSALACAFEIVAASRDLLPESTSLVIFHGDKIKLHIKDSDADWTMDERKARVAKVAERLGLTDDRGDGLSFSSPDKTLNAFTVADGPSIQDRALADQRSGIAAQLQEWEDRFRAAGDRDAVGTVQLCASIVRDYRPEVES